MAGTKPQDFKRQPDTKTDGRTKQLQRVTGSKTPGKKIAGSGILTIIVVLYYKNVQIGTVVLIAGCGEGTRARQKRPGAVVCLLGLEKSAYGSAPICIPTVIIELGICSTQSVSLRGPGGLRVRSL